MGNCIVTKLSQSINNPKLLTLGEKRIMFNSVGSPTNYTQQMWIKSSSTQILSIVGNGYFTNDNLSDNLGTELLIQANTGTYIYVSNGATVSIPDKYSVIVINLNSVTSKNTNKEIDLSDLIYSPLTDLWAYNCALVYGDVSDFAFPSLNILALYESSATGSLNKQMQTHIPTSQIIISGTAVVLDVSLLGNYTGRIGIMNCPNVYGDITGLKNAQIVTSSDGVLVLTSDNLYGDIADLDVNEVNANDLGSFTWSHRTRSQILSLWHVNLGDDVDTMFNDQAGLAAYDGSIAWMKNIRVYGNRTTASDAAITTLKNKGYTIYVNDTKL